MSSTEQSADAATTPPADTNPIAMAEATAPAATAPEAPFPSMPASDPVHAAPLPVAEPVEIVSRGILWSLAAIPLGMIVAVVIWRLGFIASISTFVVAGAAAWLYAKGATTMPRRGLLPLVGVILVGVALSFMAIVASDIVEFWGTPEGKEFGYDSVWAMLQNNLFNTEVLGSYGSDLAMFVGFAALGVFGTLRQLASARRG